MFRFFLHLWWFLHGGKTIHRLAPFNCTEDLRTTTLTWQEAQRFPLLPYEFPWWGVLAWRAPTVCPVCAEKLWHRADDWWVIEDSGQFMVQIDGCPNGHGAYVEYA